MKVDQNILFEYLRSIIFDDKIQKLDKEELDESMIALGEGLEYLAHCTEELNQYARNLSKGNLNIEFPKEHAELCNNLKNLHANLNHLTWQIQRVKEGDYSQKVTFLGDFSDTFNQMIEQLSERETLMKEAAKEAKAKSELLESYNSLLIALTEYRSEWIIVERCSDRKILYCNKKENDKNIDNINLGNVVECNDCKNLKDIKDKLLKYDILPTDNIKTWETKGKDSGKWYKIHSYNIEWEETKAYVHIIEDNNERKKEEILLNDMVYRDPDTNYFNRRYMVEKIEKYIKLKENFVFIFIDIDGLKYINDKFGHVEGDRYIKYIADSIKNIFRQYDIICRIGGDEFGILLKECSSEMAEYKINREYASMKNSILNKKYGGAGFSYGVIKVDSDNKLSVEDIIAKADKEMYKCKLKHKGNYNNGRI